MSFKCLVNPVDLRGPECYKSDIAIHKQILITAQVIDPARKYKSKQTQEGTNIRKPAHRIIV